MKLKVTLGHIAKAKSLALNSHTRMLQCPIALALFDATGTQYSVGWCGINLGEYGKKGCIKICDCPKDMQEFILKFDNMGEAFPTEFNLPF